MHSSAKKVTNTEETRAKFRLSPAPKRVQVFLVWFSHQTIRGIARYAREVGWQLDLSPSYTTVSEYKVPADGMITFSLPDSPIASFLRQRSREIPAVDMTGQDDNLKASLVLPDNLAIGRLGARHFLDRGYEHLAFVSMHRVLPERERMSGFKAEVQSAGKQFYALDSPTPPADTSSAAVIKWMKQALLALPRPLAVMPLSDPAALIVLHICLESGVQVPDEIAVLGVDNDELICNFAPVPLSSVESDMERVGYEAAVLLDRLMAGQPGPQEPIRIPPKGVVLRRSSDMLAVPHPALARALRFIYDHYHDPIGTDDVVSASGMSRRGLYNAFAMHLKRTVMAEIMRLRIDRASHLLRETRLKTSAVALESGLANYVRLHRVFNRHFGMSPSAFRKSEAAKKKS